MPSWEFGFVFFISYAYICTCIRRHLKETVPSSSITWSEMGKQNVQAEKVYWKVADLPSTWFFSTLKASEMQEIKGHRCKKLMTSCSKRVPNRVLQSHHRDRNFLLANPDPGHIFFSPYLNENDPWSSRFPHRRPRRPMHWLRGEWLGRPANFKGAGYCLAFKVETGSHVTYIVHHCSQHSKQDGGRYRPFLVWRWFRRSSWGFRGQWYRWSKP